MERLSLETFVTAQRDSEIAQYAVMSGMQDYRREFSRSRLYPALSDLIQLHQELSDFIQRHDEMNRQFPKQLKGIDERGPQLVFEPANHENSPLEAIIEVIQWALPLIQKAIEEGAEIYNFVEEHISIDGVGVMPMYCDEGYWFVPENRRSLLHLMRYEISLYSSSAGRHRTLKTTLLESIENGPVTPSPESVKLSLLERYHELPNPATFQCDTDLEFPYSETLLPVAKRKLMAHLFS
ncbi:MAG: hypothetical protein WBG01_02500 [Bacteroidota bacterium]